MVITTTAERRGVRQMLRQAILVSNDNTHLALMAVTGFNWEIV